MKKFISVINPDMVEDLLDMGLKGVKQNINGRIIYSFELTNKLYKYLKSKENTFSKKDYFEDSKLRF